jgi:hypothetical protein
MNANYRIEHDSESSRFVGPWLMKWGVGVLLGVSLLAGGVNLLVPRSGSQLRIGWYLQSNQWKADARTAAAAVRYVLDREPAQGLSGIATGGVGPAILGDLAQTNNLG